MTGIYMLESENLHIRIRLNCMAWGLPMFKTANLSREGVSLSMS
jgi:hypothetical protein